MKKLVSLLALSTVLLFSSFNTHAVASSQTDPKTTKKELNDFSNQTDGLEIVDVDELPEGTPMIEFDNMDEFKKAVEELQLAQEINADIEEDVVSANLNSVPEFSTMAAAKNGTSRIKWNSAGRLDYVYKLWLPSSLWIDFTYTYTGTALSSKKFTKIKTVKSGSNGVPSSWHQTTHAANISGNKKVATIKIQGYHLLGVKIGGQGVGAKFTDSYTKKYDITKKNQIW